MLGPVRISSKLTRPHGDAAAALRPVRERSRVDVAICISMERSDRDISRRKSWTTQQARNLVMGHR